MLQDTAIRIAEAQEKLDDAFDQGYQDVVQNREHTQFYRNDCEWEAWEIGKRWAELEQDVRKAHIPMEDREDY